MNGRKIKMPFAQAMELVAEMVKVQAITRESGKRAAWLSDRFSGKASVTEEDAALLSDVLGRLGERVGQLRIVMCHEPEAVAGQIKELKPLINMRYLYERTLGKTKSWWSHRMFTPNLYPLLEDEVLKINIAFLEMATQLGKIAVEK